MSDVSHQIHLGLDDISNTHTRVSHLQYRYMWYGESSHSISILADPVIVRWNEHLLNYNLSRPC